MSWASWPISFWYNRLFLPAWDRAVAGNGSDFLGVMRVLFWAQAAILWLYAIPVVALFALVAVIMANA